MSALLGSPLPYLHCCPQRARAALPDHSHLAAKVPPPSSPPALPTPLSLPCGPPSVVSVSRLFSLPTHLLRRGSETLLQTSSPAYLLHTSLPEAPQVPTPSRSPSLLRGPRPGNRSSTGPVDQDRHPGVVLGDFSLTQHPSTKAPGGHRQGPFSPSPLPGSFDPLPTVLEFSSGLPTSHSLYTGPRGPSKMCIHSRITPLL